MSAGLISGMFTQHDFRDDLKSSIYVLLWVTLMYSTVSDKSAVPPFLSGVLDPQPYDHCGSYSKMDFLKGQSFLPHVEFPGRPALHQLIVQLATLFSVCYEKEPTLEQRKQFQWILDLPEAYNSIVTRTAYEETIPGKYDQRMSQLKDHTATIELFNTALSDHSAWPLEDPPVLQVFDAPQPMLVTKSGWNTMVFIKGSKESNRMAIQSNDQSGVGKGET